MGGMTDSVEETLAKLARQFRPNGPDLGTDEPPALLWRNDAWDETALPLRPWIARGYLLRGHVTVMGGAGAAGKSMLILAYAVACVLRRSCGQFEPLQPCRAVVLNAEDDDDEQRMRLSAALRWHGKTPADLAGNLVRVSLPTGNPLVHYDPGSGQASPTEVFADLEARIAAFKPDVVMLDPLIELHDGPETNEVLRAVCALFRRLARKHNCAVLIAHHVRKGSAEGAGDPDIIRGGSSLIGLSRVALTVVTMTADEAKALDQPEDHRRYFFRVDDAKANYSPARTAAWFERAEHQLANGELVAAAHPWEPPSDNVSLDDCVRLLVLIARGYDGKPLSPKLDLHERSFRQACLRVGIKTTGGQQAALRMVKANHGVVEAEFKQPRKTHPYKGLRTREGEPRNALWMDTE
jgi:hypothetical protein